ncbi:MAG: SusE domain-containing protein, partial [Bacteroidales bacterium]|nr:SusE domain-containing protein [Bacteroidales bacterium]
TTVTGSAVVRMYIPVVVLNVPEVTANVTSAVLAEATKMERALELSWTDAALENEAVKYYEIEFAKADDADFADPVYSEIITGRSVFFYQLDLNIMLLKAGVTLGQETPLVYRVKAVPVNDKVKGSVSEAKPLSVISYTRPIPTDVRSIYIAGSGVESGWSIPSEIGRFEDKGNGIFEWTGTIKDNGGTFKILFNGGWSWGFRHGSNDYYWEDAQFVTNIGDNDYGVVLAKGTYKLIVDVNKGTLSREIISCERTTIDITECKNWSKVELPSINESNTVFQGNVTFTAEDGFIVVMGDGNRNWVRNTRDAEYGTRWKMSERRSKEAENETLWFHAAESRSYKVTVDIQNNILTLE